MQLSPGGNASPAAGHQQPQSQSSSVSEQPSPGDTCEAGSGSCCRCKPSAVTQKNKRNAAVEWLMASNTRTPPTPPEQRR